VDKSAWMKSHFNRFDIFNPSFSFLLAMHTRAPRAQNVSVSINPTPLLPPVIKTVFPETENNASSSSSELICPREVCVCVLCVSVVIIYDAMRALFYSCMEKKFCV